MKSKYIIIILVLALAGLGWWYFGNPSSEQGTNEQNQTNQESAGQNDETVVEEVPNALEGELLVSTDKRRGNLMLLLKDSDRIIYLNTSRDFSSLVGKQVSVSIEGSLDDFRLLDIKER